MWKFASLLLVMLSSCFADTEVMTTISISTGPLVEIEIDDFESELDLDPEELSQDLLKNKNSKTFVASYRLSILDDVPKKLVATLQTPLPQNTEIHVEIEPPKEAVSIASKLCLNQPVTLMRKIPQNTFASDLKIIYNFQLNKNTTSFYGIPLEIAYQLEDDH